MLRATLVLVITTLGLSLCLFDAFYGLLLYTWYSFVSPLELTYGILAGTRLSFAVAVVFIVFAFFQTKTLFVSSFITFLIVVFCVIAFGSLAVLQTYTVKDIFSSTEVLNKVSMIAIISPVVVTNIKKLKIFILIIVLSIGIMASYYGVFGLLSGSRNISGAGRVGDNNSYALMLVSALPLFPLVIKHIHYIYLKVITFFCLFGTLLALVLTYSRGGLVATVTVSVLWLISIKKKLLIPLIFLVAIGYYLLLNFNIVRDFNEFAFEREFREHSDFQEVIDSYVLRISTLLSNPEETSSGSSRIHFWKVATLMANDNPMLGVGLGNYAKNFDAYDFSDGAFGPARSVHSTPFLVLAELGYLGFFVFVLIFIACFISLDRSKKRLRSIKDFRDKSFLLNTITVVKIAFIGYLVAGSLVVALFQEILWTLISIVIIFQNLTKRFVENKKDLLSEG